MRFYCLGYLHADGEMCELRRFSSQTAADRCSDLLNEAVAMITGYSHNYFVVLTSYDMDPEQWPPDDSTGILEIDRDIRFDE